eukprot:Gb_04627 [translate_table: standard]
MGAWTSILITTYHFIDMLIIASLVRLGRGHLCLWNIPSSYHSLVVKWLVVHPGVSSPRKELPECFSNVDARKTSLVPVSLSYFLVPPRPLKPLGRSNSLERINLFIYKLEKFLISRTPIHICAKKFAITNDLHLVEEASDIYYFAVVRILPGQPLRDLRWIYMTVGKIRAPRGSYTPTNWVLSKVVLLHLRCFDSPYSGFDLPRGSLLKGEYPANTDSLRFSGNRELSFLSNVSSSLELGGGEMSRSYLELDKDDNNGA